MKEFSRPTKDLTDSSTGIERRPPPPDDRIGSFQLGTCKTNSPTAPRTNRFHYVVCNRNSRKPKTRHTSTGSVREIPHLTNDETDSNAGRVRETLDSLNDERDYSAGRVREIPLPTNDKTDTSTGRVRETPHPPNDEKDYSKGRVR